MMALLQGRKKSGIVERSCENQLAETPALVN